MHGAIARYLMSRSIAVVFPHWMQQHGQLGEEHAFRTFEHVVRVAGPWPLEERWWDPRRKRRQVRMQVLVRHPRRGVGVFLVGLENQQWTLLARYD